MVIIVLEAERILNLTSLKTTLYTYTNQQFIVRKLALVSAIGNKYKTISIMDFKQEQNDLYCALALAIGTAVLIIETLLKFA